MTRPKVPLSGERNELLDAALAFAKRGWPVFPCNTANKQPLLAASKDPETGAKIKGTGGVSRASVHEQEIRTWWKRWPLAMVGLATGHAELFAEGSAGTVGRRLFVLDFDPRHDPETGEDYSLERLKAETEAQIGCALPPTLAARTPSGGVHLYYATPDDGGPPIRNRGNLPLHVDVRGLGGYVIAPPSFMEDGRRYRWLHGAADAAIAEAPDELVATLRAPKPAKASPPSGGNVAGDQPASASAPPRREDPAQPPPGDAVEAAKRRYAMSALDRECELLAKTPVGARNNQANASGFVIGQLVGAGALGESFARAALHQACMGFNDPAKNQEAVDNGIDAGMAAPRDLSEVAENARRRSERPPPRSSAALRSAAAPAPRFDGQGLQSSHSGDGGHGIDDRGAGDEFAPPELTRRCAFRPHTDLGNLERFLDRFGGDFLYVEAWGWLAWDGRRWNRDMALPLLGRAVQATMRAIQDEAKFVRDSGWKRDEAPLLHKPDERDEGLDYIAKWKGKEPVAFSTTIAAWGRTSEGAGHIGCIAKLAEARLSARPADFDADALLLNMANGTLVFLRPDEGYPASVSLRPPRREDRITKIGAAAYDPAAGCTRYDEFLETVQPTAEMRDFLDTWAGYNALGLADAQKMALFYGEGSNGKGVWVTTKAHILGDYAWATGIETFIDAGKTRKGSDASPDLAALAGRRMVYANEPEDGSKFSDGLIKSLTSDEPKGGVREMFMPPFELQITFTNTVMANNMPRIGTDHGIQRRVQVVPWTIIIPDDRQDLRLKDKLKAEASGILNRIVRGALRYLDEGLKLPDAVREATKEYQAENDLLGKFLELCVARVEGATVAATPFHRTFAAWQTWAGQIAASGKPWSMKYLTSQMKRKSFKNGKSNTMQWQDVALRYAETDFCEFDPDGRISRPREGELPAPAIPFDVAPPIGGGAPAATTAAPPVPPMEVDDDDLPYG